MPLAAIDAGRKGACSAPKGSKRLAGGVSRRCPVPQYGSPGGAIGVQLGPEDHNDVHDAFMSAGLDTFSAAIEAFEFV